jgi:hypothetical protein
MAYEMGDIVGIKQSKLHVQDSQLTSGSHQTMQKRARHDTTILPHAAGIDNLRTSHTAHASNQRFANQFVSAEIPTRAMPSI